MVIIKNPSLIRECRKAGCCDYCGKHCKRREGAHLLGVGAGGSDIRCNLVCLGQTRTFQCDCHTLSHAANSGNRLRPNNSDLWAISAMREGCTVDELREAMWFICRLDKAASKYRIVELMTGLSEKAKALVRRELEEAGKL